MKKKWFLIVIIIAIFGVGIFFYNKKNIYINIVLSQSSYNYLPKEAKNYIKEVYNKTGNVLKTEKNKEKDNFPFTFISLIFSIFFNLNAYSFFDE